MNTKEWIGYFAAALVVVSFLVSSKVRVIRTINLLGSSAFVLYGFLLNITLPIIIPNAFIAIIQIYYLVIKKDKSANEYTT